MSRMSFYWDLNDPLNLYNFQQRISWLSHRWRTQRNAISNVNCRIQWIIESLNAPCALWYSGGHACLSVINFSTSLVFITDWSLDVGVCWRLRCSALLKCISRNPFVGVHSVIIIYALVSSTSSNERVPSFSERSRVTGWGFALVLYLGMGFAFSVMLYLILH
jgi:hypothetical protein